MKVLFLDSWTQGIRMFLPINDYLKGKGADCLLVHWGSWDVEPGRPKEEVIDGLLCRDITYYKTGLIYKVMKREMPDCVVMLTTNNLIDRAKILAARALGIPSVFLMHGIIAISDTAVDDHIKVMESVLRRKRFSKVPKHLRYIIPNYFYSGMKKNPFYLFGLEPYGVLYNTFQNPEKWKQYPDASAELQCDYCLAWGQVYKDFMVTTYGYKPESVIVTGHPPLDVTFHVPSGMEIQNFIHNNGIDNSKPFVAYIEGAFAYSEYEGWTEESLLAHLLEISGLCSQAGRHLVIKLHPSTENVEELIEQLEGRATVLQSADSRLLLYAAESVIGHSSTLINTAIAFNKTVFIPRWGISKVIPKNFDDTGAVRVCNDPRELLQGIANIETTTDALRDSREAYIRDYLAPLDGQSQHRICETIEHTARSKD